nr:MAG TPA: hypothetical protein [Caudoviricetes sp.]
MDWLESYIIEKEKQPAYRPALQGLAMISVLFK